MRRPPRAEGVNGGSAAGSSAEAEKKDGEGNDGRKEGRVSYVAVAAVLGYAACSVAMVLTNKALAMLPAWRDLDLVLLPVALQNVSALALLVVYRARCSPARLLAALRGLWPGFSRAVWCVPCSVAFVAMILTSFLALSGVSVPFVTVGKNASNLLTALGEWLLLGSKPTRGKALALGIMFFGAFAAAWHDLAFSLPHYSWLALNCASTSAYVLMMRVLSLGGRSLPDREATIAINNGVSLLLILVAAAYKGELSSTVIAAHFWELFTPGAVFLHLLAGCCAFMLNFATMRCVAATSATTYAMVGAANKLPTAVIGYAIWRVPMSPEGVTSIVVGLLSTLIYALQ